MNPLENLRRELIDTMVSDSEFLRDTETTAHIKSFLEVLERFKGQVIPEGSTLQEQLTHFLSENISQAFEMQPIRKNPDILEIIVEGVRYIAEFSMDVTFAMLDDSAPYLHTYSFKALEVGVANTKSTEIFERTYRQLAHTFSVLESKGYSLIVNQASQASHQKPKLQVSLGLPFKQFSPYLTNAPLTFELPLRTTPVFYLVNHTLSFDAQPEMAYALHFLPENATAMALAKVLEILENANSVQFALKNSTHTYNETPIAQSISTLIYYNTLVGNFSANTLKVYHMYEHTYRLSGPSLKEEFNLDIEVLTINLDNIGDVTREQATRNLASYKENKENGSLWGDMKSEIQQENYYENLETLLAIDRQLPNFLTALHTSAIN